MSVYVALDGPDGCGKSTQAEALADWVRDQGRAVLHVREPGSTPVGEALRRLLLDPGTGALLPLSEMLLFSAARAELVARVIAPATAAGTVVIAERCYLSTLVYQLLANGAEEDVGWLFELTRRVHGAALPDAIFVLDVPLGTSRARRHSRDPDRIEARGGDYHERVRRGFRRTLELEVRAVAIDAAWPFASVQATLRAHLGRLLARADAEVLP